MINSATVVPVLAVMQLVMCYRWHGFAAAHTVVPSWTASRDESFVPYTCAQWCYLSIVRVWINLEEASTLNAS